MTKIYSSIKILKKIKFDILLLNIDTIYRDIENRDTLAYQYVLTSLVKNSLHLA